jgi:chorismate-pyruvate lyase
MFFPFLKIVKKTLTRWSQVTKKGKIRQTQNNKPLGKVIKKTTTRTKSKEN